MNCCNTKGKNMVDLGPLIKIKVPTPAIVPVGITPAITAGGKVVTQTQGRGEGIFSKVVDAAALLYSTVKGATSTPSAAPAMAAGQTYGTGNFTENVDHTESVNGKSAFFTLLIIIVAAKLLKLL